MPLPAPRTALLVAALALAACHPGGKAEHTAVAPPPAADAGAPVLAAVQNARAAIAAGDAIAAFNDVNLGLGFAARLPDGDSSIYPPQAAPPGYANGGGGNGGQGGGQAGAQGGHGGPGGHHHHGGGPPGPGGGPAQGAGTPATGAPAPARPPSAQPADAAGHQHHAAHGGQGDAPAALTSFDAQVRLISAQAKLQARDAAGADADLQALEAAANMQAAPTNLPLIRADQSLTLAAGSVSTRQLGELRTQLAAAQAALEAYQGAPHAAEAKALAAAIGAAVRQPAGLGALTPAELALWSGRVGSWT